MMLRDPPFPITRAWRYAEPPVPETAAFKDDDLGAKKMISPFPAQLLKRPVLTIYLASLSSSSARRARHA